jgi:hypothetical protein
MGSKQRCKKNTKTTKRLRGRFALVSFTHCQILHRNCVGSGYVFTKLLLHKARGVNEISFLLRPLAELLHCTTM